MIANCKRHKQETNLFYEQNRGTEILGSEDKLMTKSKAFHESSESYGVPPGEMSRACQFHGRGYRPVPNCGVSGLRRYHGTWARCLYL